MGASVGRLRSSNGLIWFHCISVFGIAQRALFILMAPQVFYGDCDFGAVPSPGTARSFRGNGWVTRNPNGNCLDTLLCLCGHNPDIESNLWKVALSSPDWMSLWCTEELASVARCKVTMSSPMVVLYEIYTEIYMYNLVLYPAKNVWSEPGIMPYFAPSTTVNALSSGAKSWTYWHENSLLILWFLGRMTD